LVYIIQIILYLNFTQIPILASIFLKENVETMELVVHPLDRVLAVTAGANLLETLRAHDVPISYSCMSGRCGTCRCKVVEGRVDMDANHALEDYEIARGFVLSCQAFAASERLVLDFDQDS
jgi:ferredoxin